MLGAICSVTGLTNDDVFERQDGSITCQEKMSKPQNKHALLGDAILQEMGSVTIDGVCAWERHCWQLVLETTQ